MKSLGKYISGSMLLALVAFSTPSSAWVVSSGFALGPTLFDSKTVTLDAGKSYVLQLDVIDLGAPLGVPSVLTFGITQAPEHYQVPTLTGSGTSLKPFTAGGGSYTFLVGGLVGAPGTLYSASINAVPVPAAIWMFASAIVGVASIGRKKVLSIS